MEMRTKYEAPVETNVPGIIYMPQVPILDQEVFQPCQLFDDLYFIGTKFIGTLVVKTEEGLVFIDSMNHRKDVETIIMPGLAELGLDKEKVLAVIITHGHFDHFGGAAAIQEKYGCQVIMSGRDDEFMRDKENPVPEEFARYGVEYPEITAHVEEGSRLVLGGKEFLICYTPGHTPGGVSLAFPVYDHEERHVVSIWGGINPPADRSGCLTYVDSAEHFREFCNKAGCDVEFSLHPFVDYSIEKMDKIRGRKPNERHPLVIGKNGVNLFMEIIKITAAQKAENLKME